MTREFSMNKVIRTLTLSDIMVFASLSMLAPVLPVFVVDSLPGGSLSVAGIAIGLQWITRALFELPIAYALDKHQGEFDDFLALIIGSFIISIVPFFFIVASNVQHIYLIQIISGIGYALNHPSWTAIFNRHVDAGHVAWDYGLYGVLYALGVGIAGILSGILGENFGYNAVFIFVGVVSIIGSAYLITIRTAMMFKK